MSAPARKPAIFLRVLLLVGAAVVLATGLLVWSALPRGPMPQALAALQGTERVSVTTTPWGVFEPKGKKPKIGLVVYPANRVDWRSYAPLALSIARRGILVVIVPMPLNIPALDMDKARSVFARFQQIRLWALAGHSEGGATAARFAARHPSEIRALVLWGARPAAGDNLSSSRVAVLSIAAERDGLVTPLAMRRSAWLLPASTRWVTILGGNHAQFGWYGTQWGDGTPLITREQQQEKTARETVEMLRSLAL